MRFPSRARAKNAMASFVIAGGAELRGGSGSYPERIVRYRDLSPEGLKEKVKFTVASMEERLGEFGFGWKDTTAVQAYTVHDFHAVVADELVRRGAMRSGLTGISPGHRSSISNTRWIAAASHARR